MLKLPETPLSASESVAVRTRRSIPLPAEASSGNSSGGQSLQIGSLTSKVEPTYPKEALDQRIEGTVRLHARISAVGAVEGVDVIAGPPSLAAAASNAVRTWRYAPTLYDSEPIETEDDIVVVFRLPH
jgi:protein TonB